MRKCSEREEWDCVHDRIEVRGVWLLNHIISNVVLSTHGILTGRSSVLLARFSSPACSVCASKPHRRFWSVLASILQHSYQESVRELEKLRRMSRGTLELPILAALVYAHSRCDPIDHAEIESLNEDMRREERVAVLLRLYIHAAEHYF